MDMEEVIVKNNDYDEQNKALNKAMAICSAFVSLILGLYCFYFVFTGTLWFIALGIIILADATLIILPLLCKDEYKAMYYQGIIQIVYVLLTMPYLLFMILWNDPNHVMDYSFLTFLVLSVALLFKAAIYILGRALIKNNYHPLLHAYCNNSLISALTILIVIELILVNLIDPGSSTAVFENLLQEKSIWSYIVDIALNAAVTIVAAFLALSTLIRATTKEQLSATNKIKHTIKWFNDNEISMFFGLITSLYLAVLSLINMTQSPFYILLFVYYIGTASIRFINYIWHRHILKKVGDNQIKENRKSSWILLFDAFTYLLFSNVLVAGAIVMMIQKSNAGANIYLFLFMIIPMGLYRFVTSNKSIKKNRKENNTYKLGISLIGLVSTFFTMLEIVAITMHALPVVWLRYVFIILAIIVVKIAVIVVAIIFVIHWLRSIVLNRRSKEKKYLKERDMQ